MSVDLKTDIKNARQVFFDSLNLTPKEGDTIVVWFSCGVASAIAAKRTIEMYGNFCNVRIVNNFIMEEDFDNRRFLQDVEQWIDRKIESFTNSKYPLGSCEEVWEDERAMSFPKGATCTRVLKKEARYEFEKSNNIDWHVLGYTADEIHRWETFVLGERRNTLPILIDKGLTKQDCFNEIMIAGIDLPRVYTMKSDFGAGYPNANCIGCVKATSPTYWNHVRQTFPDVFEKRSQQSKRMGKNGARLVRYKGKRIFLDELPPDARGRDMKTMKIECGIFCTE